MPRKSRTRGRAVASRRQELPHAVAAQRDLAADGLALAQVEAGDGLLGARDAQGCWPVMVRRSAMAASSSFESAAAAPTPMFTTIFSRRGTSLMLSMPRSCSSLGDLGLVLFLQARSSHFVFLSMVKRRDFPTCVPRRRSGRAVLHWRRWSKSHEGGCGASNSRDREGVCFGTRPS